MCLVDCLPFESYSSVYGGFILHIVNDILRKLVTKRENFALLFTDAVCYMSVAGRTLKEYYASLMHVTCIAHLLLICAWRVHAHFKNADGVVATIKNKNRKIDF